MGKGKESAQLQVEPQTSATNEVAASGAYAIAPERLAQLRERVGVMVFRGLKRELDELALSISTGSRRREMNESEIAEFEVLALEIRAALERALREPTGDLRRGSDSIRGGALG